MIEALEVFGLVIALGVLVFGCAKYALNKW